MARNLDPKCRQCHTTDPEENDASVAGVQCEACHGTANTAYKTAHADNTDGGSNEVEIPTTYGAGTVVPGVSFVQPFPSNDHMSLKRSIRPSAS